MSKAVSAVLEWINNGRLLEGREPFKDMLARDEFFKNFHDGLVGIGWIVEKKEGKLLEEECLFKKDDRQYKLELVNGDVYKFSKQ